MLFVELQLAVTDELQVEGVRVGRELTGLDESMSVPSHLALPIEFGGREVGGREGAGRLIQLTQPAPLRSSRKPRPQPSIGIGPRA